MKRVWVWFTVAGGIGLLTAIVLTVIEGMKYRIREEQGLDPIWAPSWVAGTTFAGLAIFALSAAVLVAIGIDASQKRRR